MNNKILLVTCVASGLLLLVLLRLFLSGDEETAPELVDAPVTIERQPEPVTVRPPPAPIVEDLEKPDPEPLPEPEIEVPEVVVQQAPEPPVAEEPEAIVLPGLNGSDSFVQAQISDMANAGAIRSQLTNSQIIRKFVVMVDGMSRGGIPDRDLPVTRTPADMDVTAITEEFYRLEPASYERFTPLVNTFSALNNQQLVTLYEQMKPLFDSAFRELGYPDRDFNTTLQQAMTNIQDVQLPLGEILLTRPSVNYHFADPVLENRTDLEKLFIRMGPENTTKVQNKVRELRNLLRNNSTGQR